MKEILNIVEKATEVNWSDTGFLVAVNMLPNYLGVSIYKGSISERSVVYYNGLDNDYTNYDEIIDKLNECLRGVLDE